MIYFFTPSLFMDKSQKLFMCPKLERRVNLCFADLNQNNSFLNNQPPDKIVNNISDCDSAEECGVKDKSGEYNWSKCVCK